MEPSAFFKTIALSLFFLLAPDLLASGVYVPPPPKPKVQQIECSGDDTREECIEAAKPETEPEAKCPAGKAGRKCRERKKKGKAK